MSLSLCGCELSLKRSDVDPNPSPSQLKGVPSDEDEGSSPDPAFRPMMSPNCPSRAAADSSRPVSVSVRKRSPPDVTRTRPVARRKMPIAADVWRPGSDRILGLHPLISTTMAIPTNAEIHALREYV